jgi:hypothetical protein
MWPLRVAEKSWANIETFLEAFQYALGTLKPMGWDALDLSKTFGLARGASSHSQKGAFRESAAATLGL